MGAVFDLADARERRHKDFENRLMEEIGIDFTNYNIAIESLENMPKALVVRVVQYCLSNLIEVSDIRKKFDY